MFLRNLSRLQANNLINASNYFSPVKTEHVRPLFTWLNKIFNAIDYDRLQKLGPERCCSEWLLRNGAKVKWLGAEEFTKDYNTLPKEDYRLNIVEVDATGSSISHYGFGHFIGCKHIRKVILHDCSYIENEAIKQLHHLKNSLLELQVSLCGNITDDGLRYIKELYNLQDLMMFELHAVKDKELIVNELQAYLPKCQIQFDDIWGTYFDENTKLKKPKSV